MEYTAQKDYVIEIKFDVKVQHHNKVINILQNAAKVAILNPKWRILKWIVHVGLSRESEFDMNVHDHYEVK